MDPAFVCICPGCPEVPVPQKWRREPCLVSAAERGGGWDFLLITVSICSHLPNCFFAYKFATRYTSLFFSGTTCYDWKRTPLTNCQDSKGCEWLLRLYIRSDYHERPGYSSKYMGVSSAPSQKDPNRRRPRRGDLWEEWTGNSQPVVTTKMSWSKTVGSLLQTCNPSRYIEYIWIYLSYIVLQYVLQPFPPYAEFQCGFRCFPEDQLASSVRWLRCGQIWKWRGTAGDWDPCNRNQSLPITNTKIQLQALCCLSVFRL